MKNSLLLTLFVIFFSCHNDRTIPLLLDRAESLIETQPDSAEIFLDSIQMPDKLNDKLFARWCFLQSKTADKLHKEMPYVEQLSRALQWYAKHGTAKQQAWTGLYLGRSYTEDKLFIPAINAYSDALEIAQNKHIYNVAGYICSYMADLYTYTGQRTEERRKFEEAADYFKKAGNIRSYAFALRDISMVYYLDNSSHTALSYILKADSIISEVGNIAEKAEIANNLGNIYEILGEKEKAKQCFIKSMLSDKINVAPHYLALSSLYYYNDMLDSARYYLKKADSPTSNQDTPIDRLYMGYLIEKDAQETDKALNYLEQYIEVKDSLYNKKIQVDIIDAEKRHNLTILLKQYNDLKITEYFYIILLCFSAIIILTIYLFLQAKNNYQRITLEQKEIKLNELELEIQQKSSSLEETKTLQTEAQKTKDELYVLRNNIFQAASITKRIKKLCKNVTPDKDQKLTDKDWNSLIALIQMLYPNITTFIKENPYSLTDTEKKICYLSFLQLDVKAEAILLDIIPNSVSKYRLRTRQRLNLTNQDTSIYDHLLTY